MHTIKLLILGCGNVGNAFLRMLKKQSAYIQSTYERKPIVVGICTQSKGCMVNEDGIDLSSTTYDAPRDARTVLELIDQMNYDVMIELTPISIHDGQPAIDHIRHALNRGKSVITANKGPIAYAYHELRSLADQKQAGFFYESTVMDGVPVYSLVKENLKGCNILKVEGILNATSNLVLQELSKGVSYEDAVRLGQMKGIVEKDPSVDLDGWDAAVKLTALMNVLMEARITPANVRREGISRITKEQIDHANEQHMAIKVVCRGWMENGIAHCEVAPQRIPVDSVMASINGTAAAVTITTDLLGDITVIEQEFQPEIDQTAYGVFGDLCRILDQGFAK